MDSPKTAQVTSTLTTVSSTTTLATSPSEPPSDFFSDFVDNIFLVEPSKNDCAAPGLTGLESPPFVFSSPELNANVESSLLNRTHNAQSSNTAQTEVCCTTDLVDNILADFEEAAGTSIIQALSNKAEQNIDENLAPEVCRPLKSEKEQSSVEFYSTQFDLSTSQAFKKQGNEDLWDQDACSLYQDYLDFMPQSFHERLSNAVSHGAYECNSNEAFGGAFQLPSVGQPPLHGMCQRYLQSKEAAANAPQNNFPSNFTSNVEVTTHYPCLVEDTELSVMNFEAAFNNRLPANSSQSVRTLLHPDSVGNPALSVSKPSGIGLHLNSGIDVAMKNHVSIANLGVKNEITCSENVSFSAEEKKGHESKAILLTNSIILEPCHAVKAEKSETPYETRDFDFGQSSNLEKIDKLLPRRKRKKSSVNNSCDDSKRCSCTKTKCLKLYCDCFAAGMYCSESCSCQGCFNNSENAHTVLETRHQIESRDPLAFAPTVIEDRNELPVNNENGSLSTPSLARHKKGCKCKKSMCSKQYCECFQANVGCTDRCRCNDCRNDHGKREEVAAGKSDVGRLEGRLIYDHDATALRKDISHSEFYGQQYNSPQAPSFHYSDYEMDSRKSRLVSGRCLPSPEFDSTSSSSPDCYDMFVETSTDILDVNSCKWQQINCDNGGTSSTLFIPSKPKGCTKISSIGQLRIGSSSPDTPLVQAGKKTSINCVNGSSPEKKIAFPPHYGSENVVGMNNSLGRLESRRYIASLPAPHPTQQMKSSSYQ